MKPTKREALLGALLLFFIILALGTFIVLSSWWGISTLLNLEWPDVVIALLEFLYLMAFGAATTFFISTYPT